MPTIPTPRGITPPAPGLEREEPTFVPEEDIPSPDTRRERGEHRGRREERPAGQSERE
jgi:hypothetical protein